MRIIDMFKSFRPKPQELTLDPKNITAWPNDLCSHLNITAQFQAFLERCDAIKQEVASALAIFTSENTLAAVPDRARTMSALHGQEYVAQTKKLLATATFTDIFSFEKEQDAFLEANNHYKDLTAKNTSALREFFSDELKRVQERLQALEDLIIKCSTALEQARFPSVRKVREMVQKITQLESRGTRYLELQTSLTQDLERTKKKREKIEEDMRAQQALVRNPQALESLQRAQKLEGELHDLAAKYVSVCDDLRNVMRNNPKIKAPASVKRVYDDLPKDPFQYLAEQHEAVKSGFEDAIILLEEEKPGNVKNLITRLNSLARDTEVTGRKIATMLPDVRALKRDIVKDVAALQVYDKQQFLMRAKSEQEAIETKINFLTQELDPGKLEAMKQELRAAAMDLGAAIRGEHKGESHQHSHKKSQDEEHKA